MEFGGVPATKFMDNSLGTVLTAVAPAEVGTGVQAVDVTVTTAAGTGTLSGGFAYTAPVITKISPLAGSSGGGTTVTITGSYFRGTSGVAFGGVPATKSTVNSAGTAITAVTPPETGAGVQSVDVSVTTAAGTSDLPGSFTYSAPLITKVSPYRGSPGGSTVVTITGSYFGGATAVTFGGNAGTITKVTATSITVKSPAGSGTVDVNVSTPAGVGTLASAFTYLPIVTRIAPTSGSSGAVVTVYGANFGGAEFVMFGTFPAAFEVLPAIYGYPYGTRIAAHAPSGNTGPVDVVVTTAGGSSMTSPADVFTYP